jgi:hypothetical protein
MPYYIFKNQETEEIRDVFLNMNDVKEYFGEGGDETTWKRVFTSPNASIDSKIDPFKAEEFARKTGSKKGTYGDLLDKSAELSRQRADIAGGDDPVKARYFENYSKSRRGAKHPSDLKKVIDNKNATIDFTKK